MGRERLLQGLGIEGIEPGEAAEMPDRAFAVGVQWHPEDGDDDRLFDALVRAAR